MSETQSQNDQRSRKLSMWDKLTKLAAVVSTVGIFSYFPVEILAREFHIVWPRIVFWGIFLPFYIYLVTYCLWHWRTRYAGKRPFAWAFFFAYAQFVFPAILYYFSHVVPDFRQRGAYALSAPKPNPPLPLPSEYEVRKSLCFVIGWALVIWAVMAAVIMVIAQEIILGIFLETASIDGPRRTPQELTSFLTFIGNYCRTQVWFLGAWTLAAAGGAISLYISQRMKWRITEQDAHSLATDAGNPSNARLLTKLESAFDNPTWLKTLATVACLLFVTVVASYLVLFPNLENQLPRETKNKKHSEKINVVVAFGDLASGSILMKSNMAKTPLLLTNCPPNFIEADQYTYILGRPINKAIKHGHSICWPDVLPPTNSAAGLSK